MYWVYRMATWWDMVDNVLYLIFSVEITCKINTNQSYVLSPTLMLQVIKTFRMFAKNLPW